MESDWIKKTVAVDLDDIINCDFEQFLDLLSTKATGSALLMDIRYKPVGVKNGDILFEVEGDASMVNG